MRRASSPTERSDTSIHDRPIKTACGKDLNVTSLKQLTGDELTLRLTNTRSEVQIGQAVLQTDLEPVLIKREPGTAYNVVCRSMAFGNTAAILETEVGISKYEGAPVVLQFLVHADYGRIRVR